MVRNIILLISAYLCIGIGATSWKDRSLIEMAERNTRRDDPSWPVYYATVKVAFVILWPIFILDFINNKRINRKIRRKEHT